MSTFNPLDSSNISAQLNQLQQRVQALQSKLDALEQAPEDDGMIVESVKLGGPVRFGAAEGEHWGGQTIPGIIRSHESATYKVDLYDDGFGHASTRSVSVSPLCVSFGGVVPNGTAVLVHVVPGDLIEVTEREGGS